MQILITFLEGVLSFLSPCMLPLLPLYLTYFAGGAEKKRAKVAVRALSFVLGFAVVFSLLGLFAGTLGAFLSRRQRAVEVVCGLVVILFGLSCLEVIRLPFFKGMQEGHAAGSVLSAFLFGVIYSVSLTPCVGAFLGSALMLAATSGGALRGLLLLLVYSAGLGLPFVLAALLLEQLQGAFRWVKAHYRAVNLVCGGFLILIGLLMALGGMGRFLSILS